MTQAAVTDARVKEIVDFALEHGDDVAMETYTMNAESLARYKRDYRKRFGDIDDRVTARKLLDKYSDAELRAILSSGERSHRDDNHRVDFDGETLTIGVMSDLHIGSKYTGRENIFSAFDEMNRRGCSHIFIPGDITEGMSGRPGHVYELSHIGYHAQREEAIEILRRACTPIIAIDGNHDRWYIKSNGAKIVSDIADNVPNMTFIGHDVATVEIAGVKIMLWHGEDGSSYSSSYRPQKIIESITGGKKPQVIFAGHDHKALYLFERNVHFIASGTMQEQTAWMRGKRLAAHVGFWIIEMTVADGDVVRFSPTWYPYYL